MDATKKNLVLRKIQEHKAITRGALSGMCRLLKEELEPVIKALEEEGKIKAWPGKRSDSMIYTTPDLPNPLEEIDGKKAGAKKKTSPRVAAPAAPRSVQTAGAIPPKNGGGRTGHPGDLAAFRRVQDGFNTLLSNMLHEDTDGIEETLDEIAFASLSWRRERKTSSQAP